MRECFVVRLVAVDAATLVRVGFAATVSAYPDVTLAGTAATASEARELVAWLDPDVVATDAWLPDGDGLQLGAELRAERPALGVVLLAPADDDVLFRALEAGLSAVVPQQATVEVLMASVRHAAVAPASFTAPDLAGALARRRARSASLSPRELEILQHLYGGLSLPAIAATLRLTESTVRTYVTRLYGKLGATSRAQALVVAGQQGLLPTPH
jgi:DNA-binding NarL/FixJ family response regulator